MGGSETAVLSVMSHGAAPFCCKSQRPCEYLIQQRQRFLRGLHSSLSLPLSRSLSLSVPHTKKPVAWRSPCPARNGNNGLFCAGPSNEPPLRAHLHPRSSRRVFVPNRHNAATFWFSLSTVSFAARKRVKNKEGVHVTHACVVIYCLVCCTTYSRGEREKATCTRPVRGETSHDTGEWQFPLVQKRKRPSKLTPQFQFS